MSRPRSQHPDLLPVLVLLLLALVYWSKVLFTNQVLLPGHMLAGFAPFGANPTAPWNILQWDGLGQYYPWRLFAARELQQGTIPLWNPHQFAGTPFLANGQSAVFYPLNIVFWIMDPARAFGWAAFLHTLLAEISTYFLARRWKLSRAASLVAAIAFGFCGYLSAWAMLPTLAETASWLPLCLLLLERSVEEATPAQRSRSVLYLAVALCCALLAGHAQVFFYIVLALLIRAVSLPKPLEALANFAFAFAGCLTLGAAQLLPTLELARLGHRAAGGPATVEGWTNFIAPRALLPTDALSLLMPSWPMATGSINENFGYMGGVCILLAILGCAALLAGKRKSEDSSAKGSDSRGALFAAMLALFGLLYAMATPLSEAFYLHVPGLSQMGGVGRALVLWSLGAALLAGYGLDFVRRYIRSEIVPLLAIGLVTFELFASGWTLHAIAPRATIYPKSQIIAWLQEHTKDDGRILFITPRRGWLPSEAAPDGKYHPSGALPPNGATVYGLNDVNGYDSLAPRAYRDFVARGEGADVSPPLNGNMILLENPDSPALDRLDVRYIISQRPNDSPRWQALFNAEGCTIYGRTTPLATPPPLHFFPGWHAVADGRDQYDPETFRFGLFVALCAVGAGTGLICIHSR